MIKVIKITSLWCSGCIVMNKTWNEVLKEKELDTTSYDYDIDEEEVEKYNPGKILPVFIFYKNNEEMFRFAGEKKKDEILEIINELGD